MKLYFVNYRFRQFYLNADLTVLPPSNPPSNPIRSLLSRTLVTQPVSVLYCLRMLRHNFAFFFQFA